MLETKQGQFLESALNSALSYEEIFSIFVLFSDEANKTKSRFQ